jgi:hypothetical protein
MWRTGISTLTKERLRYPIFNAHVRLARLSGRAGKVRELPGISGLQDSGFEEPPDRIHFPANVEPSLGKPHVIEDGASITLSGTA